MKEKIENWGRPLKEGRIHLLCPHCGRKQSNIRREEADPDDAILVVVDCPKCCDMGSETNYYDVNGKEISQELH